MTKTTTTHAYGWIPDVMDRRDYRLALGAPVPIPDHVDLRPIMPPVYDQGALGSCTANAGAAAFDAERHIQGLPFITPSRLFIYYNERVVEGTVKSDSGAQIRDIIKVLNRQGAAPETLWPYNVAKFAVKPPAKAYKAASADLVVTYARVPQAQLAIQQVLAGGRPVLIGFTVFESFESAEVASSGVAPMPSPGERALGGHAVLIVGYQLVDGVLHFLVRNSWGEGWGIGGYFLIPAAYFCDDDLARDLWVIQSTTAA